MCHLVSLWGTGPAPISPNAQLEAKLTPKSHLCLTTESSSLPCSWLGDGKLTGRTCLGCPPDCPQVYCLRTWTDSLNLSLRPKLVVFRAHSWLRAQAELTLSGAHGDMWYWGTNPSQPCANQTLALPADCRSSPPPCTYCTLPQMPCIWHSSGHQSWHTVPYPQSLGAHSLQKGAYSWAESGCP